MSNVIHPNEKEFNEVISSNETVFVDFFAAWCGPCKMLSPEIEKLADEYQGQVPVLKVDVDQQATLAQRYGIQTIPTLIVFKNGEIKHQSAGFRPYVQLKNLLES
ncbi:thioredoxin [Beduini massiliensis]|uniref:thioredoxin n=1 Tax=Beduini massiliensis TaxID=1585974 RepID=UPI00059A968B|nr:thioredoxin [Beduini massiliensis]